LVGLKGFRAGGWRVALARGRWMLAGLLLVSAWWFIRNGLLVPELAGLGQLRWLGPIRWEARPPLSVLAAIATDQLTGVWDRYGYQVELPSWVEPLGVGLIAAALVGWALGRFRPGAAPASDRTLVALVAGIAALNIAGGLYAVWISRDAGQGRFLYPGLACYAVLGLMGWSRLWPRRWPRALLPFGVMGLAAAGSIAGYVGVYRQAYQLPYFYPDDQLPAEVAATHVHFEDVADLVGAGVAPARLQPGGGVIATTCWRPLSNEREAVERIVILDQAGQAVADRNSLPGRGRYRAADWQIGRLFCDGLTLRVPVDAARQQQYYVALELIGLVATQADGQALTPVIVGSFSIPSALIFPPANMTPVGAQFEDGITLLGFSASSLTSTLQLTLYWQATATPRDSYHVFVHWFDAENALVAQSDGLPDGGGYPTDLWGAGEIVEDVHELSTETALPTGSGHFSVGLYRYPSLQRLAVTGPAARDNTATFSDAVPPP
jgi:hypothetical protein